ncbi:protein of unknown function [Pseudomonas marincola]|uniref:Uncharacterized protein n=1 Tax=Pseudomonas marincola TaxID=437900 RepID=A0A8S2BJD6_9PSED|nr:protein of unknown function [Pseudomonas marincola]
MRCSGVGSRCVILSVAAPLVGAVLLGKSVTQSGLQVEVVLCQLLVQTALIKKIINDATLGQVGFCHLDRCFRVVAVFRDKVVVELKVFFISAHMFHSRLHRPFAHLIAVKHERVKKIFSIG